MKSFVKGGAQEMEGEKLLHLNYYKKDLRKQERFRNFIFEKQGKIIGGIPSAEVRNNFIFE